MEEMDISKLTLEIFSQLEQRWLSHSKRDLRLWSSPSEDGGDSCRKTRVLTIDGGVGPDGLVAVHVLRRLESLLQTLSGNPSARIPHYFDLVAGTGLGGVLAALITASADPSSLHPMLSAAEAAELLLSKLPSLFRRGWLRGRRRYSAASFEKVLRGVFKGMTLRDTCRPLLVPCYDLGSEAPFVFSRADAAESPCYDFELWAVCRATAATPGLFRPCRVTSVDGRTACEAVGGGLVMNNPAAAAVTHVLHNRREFPHVRGVEDLLVLSIGNGRPAGSDGHETAARDRVMEIVLRGVSDTVDQILGNAFSWNRTSYVRIQANGLAMVEHEEEKEKKKKKKQEKSREVEKIREAGERMMMEKGLEALHFGGKRLMEETNAERMEAFVRRLVALPLAEKPLLLLPPPPSSPCADIDTVVFPEEDFR